MTFKTTWLNTDCTIFFTPFYFDMILRNLLPFQTSLSSNQFINLPVTPQHDSWCTELHTRTLTDLNSCPDTYSEYLLRTSSHSSLGLSQDISFETFWHTILGIFWYTGVGSSQPFSLGTSLHCIAITSSPGNSCRQDCLPGCILKPSLSMELVYIAGHCQPCTGYQSQCLTPSYKWSSTPTSSWGSHSTGSLTPPDTVSSVPAAYSFTLWFSGARLTFLPS